MTEQEKVAYMCGYRDACMKHNIPFVKVEYTNEDIIRISVEYPRYVFNSVVFDYKGYIAKQVIEGLEKAIYNRTKLPNDIDSNRD